jgi:hypothetical protein
MMDHFNSILFHKSVPANKQHTYQSITGIWIELIGGWNSEKAKTLRIQYILDSC